MSSGERPVVGGSGAHAEEVPATLLERGEIARVEAGVDARSDGELVDLRPPPGVVELQQRVGPEGRDDDAAPAGLDDDEVVEQVARGASRWWPSSSMPEPVEQRPRSELRPTQCSRQRVVELVRGFGRGRHGDAEDLDQLVLQPQPATGVPRKRCQPAQNRRQISRVDLAGSVAGHAESSERSPCDTSIRVT